MTNGAGYLALAAVIFGGWKRRPHGRSPACCSAPPRRCSSSCPRMGINVPTALLIMLPYLLALLAVAGSSAAWSRRPL